MISLAIKYRPKRFDEVVAQKYIKEILSSQIEDKAFRNAYLFTGGAGTGKTTTARIMANEINEFKGAPIEIDAASNNGVDNIRMLIDDARYKSLDSKHKIYILDEVHMLSTSAWNAMLKILEEPPENTVFILCTTDPQRIPATILSRVQRFDFTRIPHDLIVDRLKYIINEEGGIDYDTEALDYIARLADGGMRDAITMMDKVIGYAGTVYVDDVQQALGTPNYQVFIDLIRCVLYSNGSDMLKIIENIHMSGKDLKLSMRSFCDFVLDVCKFFITSSIELTVIPKSFEAELKKLIKEADYDFFLYMLDEMCKMNSAIKWESSPKPVIQATLLVMCKEDIDE